MRRLLILAVFPFLVVGTAFAGEPVFRNVRLSEGRSISLGQEFKQVSDLFWAEGSGYMLEHGAFVGAERIVVFLSEQDEIKSIWFFYSNEMDFDKKTEVYLNSLGPCASEQSISTHALSARVLVWEDARTRFELTRISNRSGTQIYAVLLDIPLSKKEHLTRQ